MWPRLRVSVRVWDWRTSRLWVVFFAWVLREFGHSGGGGGGEG